MARGVVLQVSFINAARAKRKLAHIAGGFNKAMLGAINETADETKTAMSRGIRDLINIKKKDLDKRIRVVRATKKVLAAGIRMSASRKHRIGLGRFGARQTAKGVTYSIRKGGGRTLIPGAFGPDIPRLGHHVFVRAGKSRLPIIGPLKGPSPWQVFVDAGLPATTRAEAQAALHKNLDQKVKFLLLKADGKV